MVSSSNKLFCRLDQAIHQAAAQPDITTTRASDMSHLLTWHSYAWLMITHLGMQCLKCCLGLVLCAYQQQMITSLPSGETELLAAVAQHASVQPLVPANLSLPPQLCTCAGHPTHHQSCSANRASSQVECMTGSVSQMFSGLFKVVRASLH